MKYILIILIVLVSASCTHDDRGNTIDFGLNLVTVNECQYVLYYKSDAVAIVHAGNCNNPIHSTTPDK